MKKFFLNYLIIAALVVPVVFTSCKKDDQITYTVTFNSNGGNSIDNQTVNKGGMIDKPSDPTKSENIFDGWYTDNNTFEDKWNFDTRTVTSDITLHARWNVAVTFDSDNGSAVQPQIILAGEKTIKPANPVREGFWFLGWFFNDTEWNFETIITTNTTLVAKWNPKVLDFILYNGNTYKFEYDNQNRIISYSSYSNDILLFTKTFIYNGNDLIRTEIEDGNDNFDRQEYIKNGNEITIILVSSSDYMTEYKLILNTDGYPENIVKNRYIGGGVDFIHEYQKGNLIKITEIVNDQPNIMECNYDDYKSPFHNCTTPKWYMFTFSSKDFNFFPFQFNYFPFLEFASMNNGLRDLYTQELFTYERDSDGFPTKRTNTTNMSVTELTYKK